MRARDYIPAVTGKTDQRCVGQGAEQHCKVAIQTNNVEVDDRGYIYAVDRANTGASYSHRVQGSGTTSDVLGPDLGYDSLSNFGAGS